MVRTGANIIIVFRRELTPTEYHMLRRLKRHMRDLLEGLRDSGIATVVAFSLVEPTKALNGLQISDNSETKEDASPDSASTFSGSLTIHNPSTLSLVDDQKIV